MWGEGSSWLLVSSEKAPERPENGLLSQALWQETC